MAAAPNTTSGDGKSRTLQNGGSALSSYISLTGQRIVASCRWWLAEAYRGGDNAPLPSHSFFFSAVPLCSPLCTTTRSDRPPIHVCYRRLERGFFLLHERHAPQGILLGLDF